MSSLRVDSQGRPFAFILDFGRGRTAYPFAEEAEATAFALTFAPDPIPPVIPYTPPSEREAHRLDHNWREAGAFLTIPCRFTP